MSDNGHIFLSYRSIEADFALQLAADLKNIGVKLWMDRLDVGIKVGDDWVQALQDAVNGCARRRKKQNLRIPNYFRNRFGTRGCAPPVPSGS